MTKQKKKVDRGHARFSPSGSGVWIPCPGSIPFVESLKLANYSNEPMERGTAAHGLLEHCANHNWQSPHALLGRRIRSKQFTTNPFYIVDKTMASAVEIALDHIMRVCESDDCQGYGIEDQLDIPHTGEWGTIDAWALSQDDIEDYILDVWDYKNGKHAVPAKENTQLRLYASGAYHHTHKLAFPAKLNRVWVNCKLRIHIIQPNRHDALENAIDTWETTAKENEAWLTAHVQPAVKAIKAGTAKRIAGPHCKNCRGAGRCPELAAEAKKYWGL